MEKYYFQVGNNALMEPYLLGGDKIACVKIDYETLKFYGGDIYYIELTDGQTAIRRVYDVGDGIKIKHEKHDVFGDGIQIIPKKYVQAIYRVVASARTY